MKNNGTYFIGVDIGTGSARAAVFTATGKMIGLGISPIRIYRPKEDFVEQSSENIWKQSGNAVKQAIAMANIPTSSIKGIGFDATCSLVALGPELEPISISPTGKKDQNIIVWMDHRALEEAYEINETDDEVLRYVGGKISPEMQIPKILWLKRNLPEQYKNTKKFLDLADYMVFLYRRRCSKCLYHDLQMDISCS